jgi:hypothetical protein
LHDFVITSVLFALCRALCAGIRAAFADESCHRPLAGSDLSGSRANVGTVLTRLQRRKMMFARFSQQLCAMGCTKIACALTGGTCFGTFLLNFIPFVAAFPSLVLGETDGFRRDRCSG